MRQSIVVKTLLVFITRINNYRWINTVSQEIGRFLLGFGIRCLIRREKLGVDYYD